VTLAAHRTVGPFIIDGERSIDLVADSPTQKPLSRVPFRVSSPKACYRVALPMPPTKTCGYVQKWKQHFVAGRVLSPQTGAKIPPTKGIERGNGNMARRAQLRATFLVSVLRGGASDPIAVQRRSLKPPVRGDHFHFSLK